MIIFGSKSKGVEVGVDIEDFDCPHCQQTGMVAHGAVRYFHIYWIPMFVTKKSALMVCPHCKYTVEDCELDKQTANSLKSLVYENKKLIGYNFGLFAIIALFAYMSISSTIIGLISAATAGDEPTNATDQASEAPAPEAIPAAPAIELLIAEGFNGSGFIFNFHGEQYIACSLHQFDGLSPEIMYGSELNPIEIVEQVAKQSDLQILKFKVEDLPLTGVVNYSSRDTPGVKRNEPVYIFDTMNKSYLGRIVKSSFAGDAHIKMEDTYPAAGMSGSPVISARDGNLLGVVLSADSGENATLVGFEMIRWVNTPKVISSSSH